MLIPRLVENREQAGLGMATTALLAEGGIALDPAMRTRLEGIQFERCLDVTAVLKRSVFDLKVRRFREWPQPRCCSPALLIDELQASVLHSECGLS